MQILKRQQKRVNIRFNLSTLENICKLELEKAGFKVSYYGGDPRDYSDSSYYTINW